MATVPSQRTWTAGEVVTAGMLNANVRDAVNFTITNRPRGVLRQTVVQSIPNLLGTWTAVTFDVEDLDNDGAHSTVTNTSRYTAQTAGWYEASGVMGWSNGTTGGRLTRWAINATAVNASQNENTSAFSAAMAIGTTTVDVFLNVGDYLEIQASQNSGGALNTAVTADTMSRMNVAWLGT